jgi:hypothetical protein
VSVTEETIDATLNANGQLSLARSPQLPAGPVSVTIRLLPAPTTRRGLADVIREIAGEQRARGYPGRSAAELSAEEDAHLLEDADRDRELEAARRPHGPGGP